MRDEKPREILAEFYFNGRHLELYSVTTAIHHAKGHWYGDTIDVVLSKSDGYIYHVSGSGGVPPGVDGIYWTSTGFPHVPEEPCKWGDPNNDAATRYIRMLNRTRRLKKLPREFRTTPKYLREGRHNLDLIDWLYQNAIDDEAVWCETCDDHFPSEDLCKHCWWCGSVGHYVTPSEGSVCFDADCWDCRSMRRARHEKYFSDKRQERFRDALDALMLERETGEFPEVRNA